MLLPSYRGLQENEALRKTVAELQAKLQEAQLQTPVRKSGPAPSPDASKSSTPGSSSRKTPESSLHLMTEAQGFDDQIREYNEFLKR